MSIERFALARYGAGRVINAPIVRAGRWVFATGIGRSRRMVCSTRKCSMKTGRSSRRQSRNGKTAHLPTVEGRSATRRQRHFQCGASRSILSRLAFGGPLPRGAKGCTGRRGAAEHLDPGRRSPEPQRRDRRAGDRDGARQRLENHTGDAPDLRTAQGVGLRTMPHGRRPRLRRRAARPRRNRGPVAGCDRSSNASLEGDADQDRDRLPDSRAADSCTAGGGERSRSRAEGPGLSQPP